MGNDKARLVRTAPSAGTRIERRRLLALSAAIVATLAVAACGAEDEGAGTRDNPFPYSEERTNRLRTRM